MHPISQTLKKRSSLPSYWLSPTKILQYSIPGLHSSSKLFAHDSAHTLSWSWGSSPLSERLERQSSLSVGRSRTHRRQNVCLRAEKSLKMHTMELTLILFIVCFVHCWHIVHTQYLFAKWASEWKGTWTCQSEAGWWQNTQDTGQRCPSGVLANVSFPQELRVIFLLTFKSMTKMK